MAYVDKFSLYAQSAVGLPLHRPPWRADVSFNENPVYIRSTTLSPWGTGLRVADGRSEGYNYYEYVTFGADHYSQITVHATPALWQPPANSSVGVLLRADFNDAYLIRVAAQGGTSWVWRVSNETYIGSTFNAPAIGAGGTLRGTIVGDTITVAVNGEDIATRTDSMLTVGQPGIYMRCSGDAAQQAMIMYSWEGGNVGGANAGGPYPNSPLPCANPVGSAPQFQW